MEVALAPVACRRVLAPFRLSVVSVLANLSLRPAGSKRPRDHWMLQRLLIPRRSDDALRIRFGLAAGCPPDRDPAIMPLDEGWM